MRSRLFGCFVVALLAIGVLAVLATLHETDHLYVEGHRVGLNDQAGYITTARWLADTGELRSHLIYPTHVENPHYRIYMPGNYYALAASYRLLGDRLLAWRLPALASFVIASVGIFLIGRRLYGVRPGLLAAALFMVFPLAGAFSFTAMPQLPFMATGVAAFCVFVHLPERMRAGSVPFLLVAPFLFRETGALLVIPMALLSLRHGRFGGVTSFGLAAGGSVALLSLVLASQIASGKGALSSAWALEREFNYAGGLSRIETPSLGGWLVVFAENAGRNLGILLDNATTHWTAIEPVLALAALAAVALVRFRDRLALGAVLLFATTFLLILFFYDWTPFRGTRSILFTLPLCAVAAAPVLLSWIRGRVGVVAAACLIPLVLFWSYRGAAQLASEMTSQYGARAIERLEALDIDRDRLLVSPWDISLDYTVAHYPLRWSFVPQNDETLRLLAANHEIGTLILPRFFLTGEPYFFLPPRLSTRALRELGFERQEVFRFVARFPVGPYIVFQKPR